MYVKKLAQCLARGAPTGGCGHNSDDDNGSDDDDGAPPPDTASFL